MYIHILWCITSFGSMEDLHFAAFQDSVVRTSKAYELSVHKIQKFIRAVLSGSAGF